MDFASFVKTVSNKMETEIIKVSWEKSLGFRDKRKQNFDASRFVGKRLNFEKPP